MHSKKNKTYNKDRGYRLAGIPDKIDSQTIKHGLDTTTLGSEIIYFDSIESTNILAKELAVKGAKDGTVIIADEQTGGRGRMNRNWISPAGKGIWMSIILKPQIELAKVSFLTSVVAVAVAKSIENMIKLNPSIKWPNDILIGKRKVCGIMTQMQGDVDSVKFVIVGIGINVNLNLYDFPKKLRKRSTSLKLECGMYINRSKLIREILSQFEKVYKSYIKSDAADNIIIEIKNRSATLGREVRVLGTDIDFRGRAIAIDSDGSLIVELSDGQTEKILSGDVSVRGIDGYV